jgi:hypothetical protein
LHRRGAKRSGTKLRRRHVDVACGKLGAGKSVLEVAQDAPVAAGQIEDIRKGLDSPGQHGNFDAMQGRLSDSEIVTWIALPTSRRPGRFDRLRADWPDRQKKLAMSRDRETLSDYWQNDLRMPPTVKLKQRALNSYSRGTLALHTF